MKNYIDGIDFHNLENQKYYAPPITWSQEKKKDLITKRKMGIWSCSAAVKVQKEIT